MTHVDLFSGIGGFALAAHANGIRTVQFVEIDSRCRDFLSQAWPGVSIHDDIRTFHWGVADANRKEHRQYTSEQSRQCNNTGLDSRYVKNGIRAERAPSRTLLDCRKAHGPRR
jgi:16S rRNA G966 N2-methylase RsmD